jgi:hypothetical protein
MTFEGAVANPGDSGRGVAAVSANEAHVMKPAHPTKPHHRPKSVTSTEESAPAPAATPPPAASPSAPAFIALPPASASIPAPPTGWVPRPGEDYRGKQPKAAELTNIEGAISDMIRFTNFATVLGNTVAPADQIIHLLQAGAAWSGIRVATASWDVYCSAQEGLAWTAIRGVMQTLRPSFDLAVQVNSAVSTMYPSLASLLAAQQVIARKGASTRAANKADVAAGKLPSHGKVGKARQRAAEKEALKTSTGSGGTTTTANPAPVQPVVQSASAPATTTASPAVTNGVAGNGSSSPAGTPSGH